MNLSKYNIADATHSLLCSHQIGEHRDWAGRDDAKKVRYVTPGKIIKNG